MMGSGQPSSEIGDAARQISREFRHILRETGPLAKNGIETKKLQVDVIEDAFEKYQLWAGNLGAFHNAGDTRSLDYRFRSAAPIRKRTMELLEELLDLLQNCKSSIYFTICFPAERGMSDIDAEWNANCYVALKALTRTMQTNRHIQRVLAQVYQAENKNLSWTFSV